MKHFRVERKKFVNLLFQVQYQLTFVNLFSPSSHSFITYVRILYSDQRINQDMREEMISYPLWPVFLVPCSNCCWRTHTHSTWCPAMSCGWHHHLHLNRRSSSWSSCSSSGSSSQSSDVASDIRDIADSAAAMTDPHDGIEWILSMWVCLVDVIHASES